MRGSLMCQHRPFLEVAPVTEGNKTKKTHPKKPTSCSASMTQGKTSFQITELVIRLILNTHEKCIKQTPKRFFRTSLKRTPQCPVSCLHLSPITAALSIRRQKQSPPALSLTQVKSMKKSKCGSVPAFESDRLNTEVCILNPCDLNK